MTLGKKVLLGIALTIFYLVAAGWLISLTQ